MDSRTVYVGHREPPPGAEAYIPQRCPDNRIVSSKVSGSLRPPRTALGAWALPGPAASRLEQLGCTLSTPPVAPEHC